LTSFRVLIVDDHEATRRGIRNLLSVRPDWEICGEASDGIGAVGQAGALLPDVILMDISMPRMNGLDAARIIRRELPGCAIVIVSQNEAAIVRQQALEVNASGHVGKMELPRELIPTLDAIYKERNLKHIGSPDRSSAETHNNGRSHDPSEAGTVSQSSDAERRFRLATEAANLGIWCWYLDEDRVAWENQRSYEVFGLSRNEGAVTLEELRANFVHPEDAEPFERAIATTVQTGSRFFFQGRIRRSGGSMAWVELNGQLEKRADGTPWRVLGTVLDITEYKRTELELRESEERLRLAQKASHSGTWELNLQTNNLITSPELQELFGLPPGATHYGIEDLRRRIVPEDLAAVDQTLLDALHGLREYHVEFRITLADGTLRWIEALARILLDEAGKPARIVGVSSDISERKKVEAREQQIKNEAMAATAKFRAVFEQSSVFAAIMSLDGTVIDANRLCLQVCGYRSEQVLGLPFWETPWWRMSRQAQDKIRAGAAQAAKGLPYKETLPYHWADGSERVVDFALYPILDDHGQVIFLHPTGVDITERKQGERVTGLLAAIVGSSDDAIISKNLQGMITSWNQGAERIFGYQADEAIGQHITLIIPAERLAEETTILERIKRGERVDHFETVRRRKDGSTLDISLTISPVKDASGQVVGASKVARDITERTRAEEELRRSEEKLRTLAEELENQVRARTHELEQRNAEILQQSEQLRDLSRRLLQAQDQERRHIARELHDSAGQIVTVLGMNLARIFTNAKLDAPLMAKDVDDCQELVQQLSKEIRTTSYLLYPPLLDETGLSQALSWYIQGLTQRSDLQIDFRVSDNFGRLPREMELVIYRLVQECLTNIHRHSGSKSATILLSRNRDTLSVEIQDQGRGMEPDKLNELQLQGAGVGIRGMRERVRQFDGRMNITSGPSGTTVSFVFELPSKAAVNSETPGPTVRAQV
jgi:PAS domain S-box-containing protein